MTEEMEHARAQMVQIWEDLDQKGKDDFSSMLGFKGKPESRRRSARRLVQGSRSISDEKQQKIRRSYSQRYGRDKVVDLVDREKVDVTEYFKDVVYDKTRAWTGESPPLAFQVPYRIRAVRWQSRRTLRLMISKVFGRPVKLSCGLLVWDVPSPN